MFDTLAELISKNETCTYRCLIYDLLGFEHGDYATLMSGLTITNVLVEKEEQQEEIDRLNNILNELEKYLTNEIKKSDLKGCSFEQTYITGKWNAYSKTLDKLKALKEDNNV